MEGAEEATAKRVRVFVGGLGEGVTSEDLRKIFASCDGSVESIDVIRTKGRSFAYVDFLPSSLNSLSKLFSIYNGCAWKGGRLKLERAKEHYLARLRQEWAEDAKLAGSASGNDVEVDLSSSADADEKMKSPRKAKKDLNSKDNKLQIFFPRLRKVKAIPFSGAGKHKYSFRRVEVPSLPKYFCDCEEHSGRPHAAGVKEVSLLDEHWRGINAEELDMMNSVMKKLFEKENNSSAACRVIDLSEERDDSIKAIDSPHRGEKADSSSNDDDIVTNAVSRGQEIVSTNKALKFNKREGFEHGHTQDPPKKQKRNAASLTKNGKSVFNEQNIQAFTPVLSGFMKSNRRGVLLESEPNKRESNKEMIPSLLHQKSSLGNLEQEQYFSLKTANDMQLDETDGDYDTDDDGLIINAVSQDKESRFNKRQNATTRITQEDTQAHSSDLGKMMETQKAKSEPGGKQSSSSVLKPRPSWKDLVAPKGNNEFNISDILPVVCSGKEEQSKSENLLGTYVGGNQKSSRQQNLVGQSDVTNLVEDLAEVQPTKPDSTTTQSGRGSAWLQKSSWTQLVTGNNSSAFSIAQIIPGVSFEKQGQEKLNMEKAASQTKGKSCDTIEEGKTESNTEGIISSSLSSVRNTLEVNKKDPALAAEQAQNSAAKQACNRVVAISETCSFMRSAASVKEWAKTKAALSGSLKKIAKRDEK